MQLRFRVLLFASLVICAQFLASPSSAGGNRVYLPLVQGIPPVEGLNVLPGYSAYPYDREWDGKIYPYMRFIGEIANETGQDVRDVQLKFRLYDGPRLVYEFRRPAPLFHHPAGETTCFAADIQRNQLPTWDRYEVAIYRAVPESDRLGIPAIRDLHTEVREPHYVVKGTVENDTGHWIYNVHYVSTLYDSSGQVFDCASDDTRIGPMPVGSIENFALWFGNRPDYTDVKGIKVQIVGYIE